MSQNTLTLQLFFEDPIKLKLAQLTYQYLCSDNTEQAQRWADKLGAANLESLWDAEWFNASASAASTHLLLQFDTGTSDPPPLRQLEAPFDQGLRAAGLGVLYAPGGGTEGRPLDPGPWGSRK